MTDKPAAIMTDFSSNYKEQAFLIWYKAGRVSIKKLLSLLPPNEDNRTPGLHTLQTWNDKEGWALRADSMDADVAREIEQTAIKEKIAMIRRHAATAMLLIQKGEEFLKTVGITKSADAVRAIIQGMEAERVSRGLQISLGEIEGLSDENLVQFVEKKLSLAASASDVEDADVIEGEVKDAKPE
jgi:hypothetical protein